MTRETVLFKYVAHLKYGDALPSNDDERNGDVPVFGSNGPYARYSQSNTIPPVIIIGRKGSYGKVNWSAEAVFASDTTFFIDVTATDENLRWLFYVLQTLNLDVGSNEAAVPGLNRDTVYRQRILLPPLPEQRAIADFLDRETAKIDALITRKQRLLELLAERRQALITHAVTKGLDPDVPMKDSGIEWLGEIPNSWSIASLKHIAVVRTGVAKGRPLNADQVVSVPYLRVANVQDGYIDLADVTKIEVLPHEVAQYSLQKGDVLMNEGGDADQLGRGAVWDGSIDPCLHQNHVFAVRCFDIEPEWLSSITSSDYAKAYFESRAKQTTNLASISATNLRELLVLVPPRDEQKQIVVYLEQQTGKIDHLRNRISSIISKLQERRAALINEAVTGKLKVTE